jgi:carbon-monoxide dehydrogenase small subunit
MRVSFEVNGASATLETDPGRRLGEILREDLGLTGTKMGCAVGRCGTCMVLIDDDPCNSCLVPAFRLAGRRVRTIEGLRADPTSDAVRRALAEEGAVQCGYCAPGIVVALTALLTRQPDAPAAEVEAQLAGHLCRCTGYGGIRRAVARLFAGQSISLPLDAIASE